jgi:two-component system chemotaxis sensor kinase CheA
VVESIDERAFDSDHRRIIRDVLVQLVRNAVSHGIEFPHDRTAAGKDETGIIRLSITCNDDIIRLVMKDDGNGFDFEGIKEKAISLNLLKANDTKISKQDLIKIAFSPGFSMAKETTMHAGRGIGLNLVRDRLMAVKGTIKLQSEDGKGSAFTITLPMELSQSSLESQNVTKFA